MTEILTFAVLPYIFALWMVLTALTYAGIRAYLSHHGEPRGWRFNHHGAHWFPGHLSFYPREGNERAGGVVFRSVILFPLYWKVCTGRTRSDMEIVRRGPVWRVIPWAFGWMVRYALYESEDGDGDD